MSVYSPIRRAQRDSWILAAPGARKARSLSFLMSISWKRSVRPTGNSRAGCHHLSHQSRMSVPLPDVRSVAQHAHRNGARGCHPGTDRSRASQASPGRQLKLITAAAFSIPTRFRPGLCRHRAARQSIRAVDCGKSSRRLSGMHACVSAICLAELEVAMGLETAHPEVLAGLNKRMTLDQFSNAAAGSCAAMGSSSASSSWCSLLTCPLQRRSSGQNGLWISRWSKVRQRQS